MRAPRPILTLAEVVVRTASAKGLTLSTAESCTGGLIASTLTDVAGASSVFGTGFVTYANEAKRDRLGVPQALLDRDGAVSASVAMAMAAGARHHAKADIAVSATGIAGPGGGSPEKPVGLVYLGLSSNGRAPSFRCERFAPASRATIRAWTVRTALFMILSAMDGV